MSLLRNRLTPAPASGAKDSHANSRTFPIISGRAFSRRHLLLLIIVAGALLAPLLADKWRPAQAAATMQTPTPTPAPTPDYTEVTDILNGRRHLLRADDLAVVTNKNEVKILQTANSAITNAAVPFTISTPPQCIHGPLKCTALAPLAGRMFNFSADVLVTPVADPGKLEVYSPIAKASFSHNIFSTLNVVYIHGMKMADFNGDGFDDLVVNYGNSDGSNGIQIVTATNVNAFADELVDRGENIHTVNISDDAMVVGDFNGDGRPEIIGVVPQADGNGLRLVHHTVDEKTLLISDGVYFPLTITEGNVPAPFIAAAVGRFKSTNHDQLLIAYATNGGTAKVKVIDFDQAPLPFQPQERSLWDTGHVIFTGHSGVYDWTGLLRLQVGRLNWSDESDRALLLHGNNFHRDGGSSSYDFTLSTLAINPVDFSIQQQGNLKTGDQFGTLYDLALGNFDRRAGKDRNPNLQAALLLTDYSGSTAYANIYNLDPPTFAPTQVTSYEFSITAPERMRFAAGDLQGRSMRLGEPTKVVITGTAQPTVVAAAPPMHVAYLAAVNQTQPQVLNLSALPEHFTTIYTTSDKQNVQSSSTHTNSWSFGAKESVEASYEIGSVEEGDGLKFSDTFTSAQALKGSTENTHGSYTTDSFELKVKTGFSDQLLISQSRFNIYIYPVIGQQVCPASKTTCAENDKVPLTIQFSGPDQTSVEYVAANGVEWYQPPWEYGNVLSYPGSYAQLQQIYRDINKLSKDDLTLRTNEGEAEFTTTWATGNSTSSSTSLQQNYSFENDFSVQGAVGVEFIGETTSFSTDLDLSGSTGFSDLTKSTTNLSQSTGIGVNKPGTFRDPFNYSYFMTGYIFGHKKPVQAFDFVPLTGEQQPFGLLQTAFTVDPTRSGSENAGGWWKQAYTTVPDVALNHPNRWEIALKPLADSLPANCLPISKDSSDVYCAEIGNYAPENPWNSNVHDMRGLFISRASHPGQGPQLETAQAGDRLALQARVYNYSLKAMPDGTQVKVRFYGLEWNTENNYPADAADFNPITGKPNNPGGKSFLIGEDTLPPIPPFSADLDGAPLNWALAGATFDTTPYADKHLVFWVVVWMEKDGKLASELPHHGLTGIPGTLNLLAEVPVETVTTEDGKLTSYSNNVGFYRLPFYVFKPSNSAPLLAASNGPASVHLDRVNVSNQKIELGQSVEVSAPLRTGAKSVSGVTAIFYDGDPQKGGKAFDIERISHLRASDTHQVRVSFRPRACGAHQVFITVGKGTRFETTSASAAVEVVCSQQTPVTLACSTLCQRAAQYYLNNLNRLPGGTLMIAGGGLNSIVSTSNAAVMRLALQGGNSPQARFNQQFAATQLNLLAAPGQDQAALQSPLSCYQMNFAPVRLRTGFTLSPSSSLGELLDQARNSARGSDAADLLALTVILSQLNGTDPTGRCSTGIAPSFSTVVQQSLDRALTEAMAQSNVPGAVVGVWVPGEGEWITARGVSDLATGAPMRLDNHFRIGSNTKTFTVTALLELADGPQPKLNLEDRVSKYLSFVPNGQNITLRMLANMTSGLASYTQNDDFVEALLSNPQRVWSPRELADIALAMPPHFAPGQGWHYSNTNTVLLGMIIEQVTDQSISEVFTERIFKPLGLSHTIWPTDSALPEPYPHGYTKQTLNGQQADATHWRPSWAYTAGQLISNLADMKTWARALATGTLLSPKLQAERLQFVQLPPLTPKRSYGLGIVQENGWLGHNGSLPGYTTSVFYLPAQGATIVVLTNSDIDIAGVAPSDIIFRALAPIIAPANAP